MSIALARPRRGPVQAAERALAPDLARGLLLLLIVLANTPWYLYGSQSGLSSVHPVDGSAADQVVQAVIITTVDMRICPMFAFLFGYGIVQLTDVRSTQAPRTEPLGEFSVGATGGSSPSASSTLRCCGWATCWPPTGWRGWSWSRCSSAAATGHC